MRKYPIIVISFSIFFFFQCTENTSTSEVKVPETGEELCAPTLALSAPVVVPCFTQSSAFYSLALKAPTLFAFKHHNQHIPTQEFSLKR
jgi:hypothetical protein